MTSLREIIMVLGTNSSDNNQITVKQICEFLIKANNENNCINRVWNFMSRYRHLFNRTNVLPVKNHRYEIKFSLNKNGKNYYAKLIGMNHPFASEVIE